MYFPVIQLPSGTMPVTLLPTAAFEAPERRVIATFAGRSEGMVLGIATLFALFPTLFGVAFSMFSRSDLPHRVEVGWGIWIPFCYLVIPILHYLCRVIVRLERRIEALEAGRGAA
jgi:hypothetical protein